MATDPILAAIEEHRAAWAAFHAATGEAAITAAGATWQRSAWGVVEITPTTIAGCAALAEVAALTWPDGEGAFENLVDSCGLVGSWPARAFASIATALRKHQGR
jgi:hypothetical protein